MESPAGAQAQHAAVLSAVVGASMLLVALCAFAAIVMLVNDVGRKRLASQQESAAPVGRPRRSAVAAGTAYKPLSEASSRRVGRGRETFERATSGSIASYRTAPTSSSAYPPSDYSFSRSVSAGVASGSNAPPGTTAAAAAKPLRPDASGPPPDASTQQPPPVVPTPDTNPAARDRSCSLSPEDSFLVGGGRRSQVALDDELLCRIDQALSSGIMRPEQATELLKSYGCDVEEMLREEAAAAAVAGGSGTTTPPLRPPPPVPADLPHTASLCRTSGSPAAAAGAAKPGALPAALVDDELLVRIDQALSSGAMRPEQATELLKSYGCDLEELIREELGDTPLAR